MSDSNQTTKQWAWEQLAAHLRTCQHCVPSVMTAPAACNRGKWLLSEYHAAINREAQEWYENHPEEWVYS